MRTLIPILILALAGVAGCNSAHDRDRDTLNSAFACQAIGEIYDEHADVYTCVPATLGELCAWSPEPILPCDPDVLAHCLARVAAAHTCNDFMQAVLEDCPAACGVTP